MNRPALLLLLLIMSCHQAWAAEECGWLPAARLDKAFPDMAPWSTMTGGKVGACKFLSDSTRPPNVFSATQMVKGSPAEAEAFARNLRGPMEKSYEVAAMPTLGAAGFSYKPKAADGSSNGRSMFFVGHRKQIAVMGSLNLQQAITPAQLAVAQSLLEEAFKLADDSAGLAAASDCKYFVEPVLKRLLPGPGYSVQVLGSTSCMAQASGLVVTLAVTEGRGLEALASRMGDPSCTVEQLPALGQHATLAYGCKSGSARASVIVIQPTRMLNYTFVPKREPTADERALLVDMVTQVLARP